MKRLIMLLDGPWAESDRPRESSLQRLAQVIEPRGATGVSQLVFYHGGPARAPWPHEGDVATIAGALDRELQAIYRDLALNYENGDELLLFGFSRGAYLARSLAGWLRNCWLLQRRDLGLIAPSYHIYRTLWHADADNALRFRETHARPVRVRFLGVWDTVGELGIPLELFPGLDAARYCFHDHYLSRVVDQACHALAIDERREAFRAAPWRTRADRERTQQMWFSGAHVDMGGGRREAGLAHISLRWMIEQAAQCGLATRSALIEELLAGHDMDAVHGHIPADMEAFGVAARPLGVSNADETLHPSAEQRYLRQRRYRPANLGEYLARDEQMRLPL